MLAVGDGDGRTYLWSLATHKIVATLTDPLVVGPSVSSAPAPTAARSVSPRSSRGPSLGPQRAGVNSVAFSPDGTMLAVGATDSETYLWNLATRKIIATLADPTNSHESSASGGVLSVAFSPNGTTLAAGDADGSTYLWNLPLHARPTRPLRLARGAASSGCPGLIQPRPVNRMLACYV
jgi:WD40 repeat protein